MPLQLLGQCQPGLTVIGKEGSLHRHNTAGIPGMLSYSLQTASETNLQAASPLTL